METLAIIGVISLGIFLLLVLLNPDRRHNAKLKKDISYDRNDVVITEIQPGIDNKSTASGSKEVSKTVNYRTRKN